MNGTSAPPLDLDLSSIDTSLPLLKDNEFYDLRIDKAEVKPTATPGGKFIALDMVTTAPAKTMKGEDLGPGAHVFDNVNIVPTGKATWDMVTRNTASLVQAAGLTGVTLKNIEQMASQLNGRIVRAKVGYSPERIDKNGKQLRAKNEILLYVKKQ